MQLKKLKDIIKSIGTPNKDDTLLGVFNGKTAQKSIEDILSVADYTALQNLPRTLCSGTLELTAIADGGYEASDITSVTYNGVEKFKLDKGNLLFLKGTVNEEHKEDKIVNIQTGYGCYCIDCISEKVNDNWTDYYGVTEKELQDELKTVNSALNNRQHSFDADNGLSFNRAKTILSLNNGSTVLKKADMSTAITKSGRYDIAESGDMLIGFPGVTDFTPFTLKVNKGDIIKLLFDTEKNVTDVLYIGDISQNYAETTINDAAQKGYFKNSFFDITAFELGVNTDKKAYNESRVDDCPYYTNFNYDLNDVCYKLDNIPHSHYRLIASTPKKDKWKNPIYNEVAMDNGLMLVHGAESSTLKIVPAQLDLSKSNITYDYEGENNETLKAFAENVFSYIDILWAKVETLEKAVAAKQTNEQSEATT